MKFSFAVIALLGLVAATSAQYFGGFASGIKVRPRLTSRLGPVRVYHFHLFNALCSTDN